MLYAFEGFFVVLAVLGYVLAGCGLYTLPPQYDDLRAFRFLLFWARNYMKMNGWRAAGAFPEWPGVVPGVVGLVMVIVGAAGAVGLVVLDVVGA
jgi:uncharacterized membrane protein